MTNYVCCGLFLLVMAAGKTVAINMLMVDMVGKELGLTMTAALVTQTPKTKSKKKNKKGDDEEEGDTHEDGKCDNAAAAAADDDDDDDDATMT